MREDQVSTEHDHHKAKSKRESVPVRRLKTAQIKKPPVDVIEDPPPTGVFPIIEQCPLDPVEANENHGPAKTNGSNG